jgi:hypothetical protein
MNRILVQSEHYPIREDLIGALQRYLDHGIMPGRFLTAVLYNNLREAFNRADYENLQNIANIVRYLYNQFPANAWGSQENMTNYLKSLREEV